MMNKTRFPSLNRISKVSSFKARVTIILVLLLLQTPVTCQRHCTTQDRNLTVAVLAYFHGTYAGTFTKARRQILSKSAEYVVRQLNEEIAAQSTSAVPAYVVRYKMYNTKCDDGRGVLLMDKARNRDGAVAFVGPPCERTCQLAGPLAKEWGVPMVTYNCLSTRLSLQSDYGTTARSVTTYMEMGRFIALAAGGFDMRNLRLMVHASESTVFDWVELAEEITRNAKLVGGFERTIEHNTFSSVTILSEQICKRIKGSCVVVLCMGPEEALTVLWKAVDMGCFDSRHAFVTVNMATEFHPEELAHHGLFGLLDVSMEVNRSSGEFQQFSDHVNPCGNSSNNNSSCDVHGEGKDTTVDHALHEICGNYSASVSMVRELCMRCSKCHRLKPQFHGTKGLESLCEQRASLSLQDICIYDPQRLSMWLTEGAFLADAFRLLADGLKSVISSTYSNNDATANPPDFCNINGTGVIENIIRLKSTGVKGVTGRIHINDDRSRLSHLVLRNLQRSGDFALVARTTYSSRSAGRVMLRKLSSDVLWPGNGTTAPRCGMAFEPISLYFGLLWIGLLAVAVVILIGLIVMRRVRKKRKANQKETTWVIPVAKLYAAPAFAGKLANIMGGDAQRPASQKFMGWDLHYSDKDTLGPELSRESIHNVVTGHIFAKVAVLDQQVVAVKPINKNTVALTPALVKEVNQLRRLNHANVNQLVGACIEEGSVCLVWGYCHKGSLRDVLDSTNIKLDWMFKLAFVTDVARGMNYLHSSPVQAHGRLKSTNVVVDNNWGCKVTDMAMPIFRSNLFNEAKPPEKYYRDFLWTSPEVLRAKHRLSGGTKKGDVYSFAIIVHEVYHRGPPFGLTEDDDAGDVVRWVTRGQSPPFRPKVLPDTEPDEESRGVREGLLDLMIMCWDEYPLLRLSFSTLSQNLKKMQAAFGATTQLVDQMLMMVKKYTDNLEQLVAQRTMQLEEEKKKTEQLLSKMLPQSVAEELKMGRLVIPESYASATLFFSDILEFSDIALNSTPIQVVNLLNDLYTCFDNVIETYDVYKVETIADNYVVSSGLPVRNGDKHAAHIATLALDLLTNVLSFTIRHMPDRQLLLRIGIHTGSVVSGVVGRKMPRYCLFGDTVNYTSRMESNGLPLHIHVSPECKVCLDKLGGFYLRERGLVEMKGKGKILTYFLVGKEGFQCRVPHLRPAIKELIGIHLDTGPEPRKESRYSLEPYDASTLGLL